jgi:hypothetical protein
MLPLAAFPMALVRAFLKKLASMNKASRPPLALQREATCHAMKK